MRQYVGVSRAPRQLLEQLEQPLARLERVQEAVKAPSSIALAPRQVRWSLMRDTSPTMTRMYCARSGIFLSMPSSFSTAMRVADVVDHRRDVVEAIGVREDLRPGRVLGFLLEAAVQVADLDVGA